MFIRLFYFLIVISFTLAAEENPEFLKAQKAAKEAPIWQYPYPELINYLKSQGQKSLPIFSYGSLMDVNSASKTLSPASLATRKAAIAFGIRRLFDRDVTIRPDSPWCVPNDLQARGMLNIVPSDSKYDFVNGVLMNVTIEDLPRILSREEGYNLIPVVIQDWENATRNSQEGYRVSYTFHAPQDSVYTNNTILPRPGYYELSRDASLSFGSLFFLTWFKTTYLSDGKTLISEWEAQANSKEPQTQSQCPLQNR